MISIKNKLNKKFLILLALTLALFAPAAANAEVSVTTLADFTAALADENSGDITFTLPDNITLTSMLDIGSRNVTINGGGKIITAATGARHFAITTGTVNFSNLTLAGNSTSGGVDITGAATVNFSGVTFSSNNGSTNGGAVYISNSGAAVTFDGAEFSGNGSTGTTGGAVYVNAEAEVTFATSATFTNNKASNGGAINLASGATANFTGTAKFETNTAATNGGAVFSAGTVNFGGAAEFSSNTSSGGNGGAIYLDGAASLPEFSSTAKFTSNTASTGGGAIYISGTSGTLELKENNNFTFTGNKTTGTNGNGGAVFSAGAVTVSVGTFNTNTATGSGGAIYSGGAVTVSGGTFEGNTAAGSGGAVYKSGASSAMTVSGGTFNTNTADTSGGAVFSAGALTISGGTFNSNTAAGTSANGGAVYAAGTLTVSSGTFTANKATGNGGIIASEGSTINISGGTFDGDTIATENAVNGGAIYASSATSAMTISGGTFTNNTASGSGGAIYSEGTVTLSGGDFTTANASNSTTPTSQGGGAVYADKIIVNGSSTSPLKFSNQTSTGSGGALFAKTSLTASQAIFEKNSAYSGGAMRVLSSGTLTLNNVSFVGNDTTTATTGVDGGAIYTNASTNALQYCFFKENLAAKDGGAIASGQDNSIFNIAYSYFLDNGAGVAGSTHSQGGGAMYLSPVGTATIDSCTFSGNYVNHTDSSLGGALFITNSAAVVMENSTFYNNKAMTASVNDGGAVYLTGAGEVTVKFCTFTSNSAQGASEAGRGGALFVNSGILNIIGSIVADNNTGGDIYNGGGTITSAGYNRIGRLAAGSGSSSGYINWDSNNVGTNAGNDIADNGGSRGWSFSNFFGENTLTGDNGGQRAGAGSDAAYSAIVPTIALDESDPTDTRALDGARSLANNVKIPNGSYPEYDERHLGTVKRASMGAAPDIGAFELYQSSSGDDSDNPYANLTIRSIKMSGIPNTLSIVGQTAVLHATVTYVDGTKTTTDEPLTWESSSNAVVVTNSSTGSVYANSTGTATIKVSARSGAYSDSKTITVVEDWNQDTNVYPGLAESVNQLNLQLAQDNMKFYLMASENSKTLINNSSFKSAFKNEWGSEPSTITLDKTFSNNASFKRDAPKNYDKAFTAGINADIKNLKTGAVLPLMCVWSFDISDLANDFDKTETELEDMTDSAFSKWLFENINIGFYRSGGKFLPAVTGSNQSSLQSSELDNAVTAEAASNSSSLSIQRDDGAVTVSMLAYIANVEPDGNTGSKLISSANNQKLLVVPAGTSESNISGTIWTAQVDSNSSDDGGSSKGGGGGGGGCNAAGINLIFSSFIIFLLLKNKNHA